MSESESPNPTLLPVAGLRLATADAGIRTRPADDVVLIELAAGSQVVASFTRNRFCAAPVTLAREHLRAAPVRFLLINAGNANAGTGGAGLADARRCCSALAGAASCRAQSVLPFSTGVIGQRLPVTRLVAALPGLLQTLSGDGWQRAARGIMTTDTRPKALSRRVGSAGRVLTITGMCKGAGMIHPNMATMLAYIATDAPIDAKLLERTLPGLVDGSFNSITVDGDTSTNDACVLMATGAEGGAVITESDPVWADLKAALEELFQSLAQEIVRDAEGATKFVTIEVGGAGDVDSARQVALTIAHSPLVKTALFASDPNWGRILAAVGRAPIERLYIERVSIWLDDVCIVRNGEPDPDYTEERGQNVMLRDAITIGVDLGLGAARARIWTSDLSLDYVRINAEYRT